MDTSSIMVAHIESRMEKLRRPGQSKMQDIADLVADLERLDELKLMLDVIDNANNLARLANQAGSTHTHGCTDCGEPTITFEGGKPK